VTTRRKVRAVDVNEKKKVAVDVVAFYISSSSLPPCSPSSSTFSFRHFLCHFERYLPLTTEDYFHITNCLGTLRHDRVRVPR